MLAPQSYLIRNEVVCKNLFTNHSAEKVICSSRHKKEYNHNYLVEKENMNSGILKWWSEDIFDSCSDYTLHALSHALVDTGLEYFCRVLRAHGDAGVQRAPRTVGVVSRGVGLGSGGGGGRGTLAPGEGAAVRSNLDVGESHLGIRISILHIIRVSGVRGAGAAAHSGLGGIPVERVVAVQPQHVH